MKNLAMDKFVISYSNECYERYREQGQSDFELELGLRRISWNDYRSILRIVHQAGLGMPQTMRMLEAHGDSSQSSYVYTDLVEGRRIVVPVEEWIGLHEGGSDVLYVCVCNPGKYVISPRKSILVYPNSEVQGLELYLEAENKGHNILNVVPPIKTKI